MTSFSSAEYCELYMYPRGYYPMNDSFYQLVLNNITEGIAYYEIKTDESGKPVDFTFLLVNSAFEKYTGLKQENIIGKSILKELPCMCSQQLKLAEVYNKLTLTESKEIFEQYFEYSKKWCTITAFSPQKGYIITLINDTANMRTLPEDTLQYNSKLQENEVMLETIINTIPTPIFYKDSKGIYTGCNTAFACFIGMQKEKIVGAGVFDIYPPKLAEVYYKADMDLMQKKDTQIYETKVLHADKSLHDVTFYKSVILDRNGNVSGLVGVISDITEHKQAEGELQQIKHKMENALAWKNAIFNASTVAVLAVTGKRIITEVNPKFLELFGYSLDEVIGKSVKMIHLDEQAYTYFGNSVYSQTAYHIMVKIEYQFKRKDGTIFWTEISGRAIDQTDLDKGVIWVMINITERKKIENELKNKNRLLIHANRVLKKKSIRDSLTNVYNHQFIVTALEKLLEHANRYNEALTILMVDIDHFKRVNDMYGHQAGDYIITTIVRIIKSSLRKADLIGRYGGEEFLIILPKTDMSSAVVVAERIRQNIENKKYKIPDLKITASIGLAEYHGEEISSLINHADECLYKAKRNGRNRIET